MTEFGYLIVKNPGPNTRIVCGGIAGEGAKPIRTSKTALRVARTAAESGDHVFVTVLYDDQSGESPYQLEQLTPDDISADPSLEFADAPEENDAD